MSDLRGRGGCKLSYRLVDVGRIDVATVMVAGDPLPVDEVVVSMRHDAPVRSELDSFRASRGSRRRSDGYAIRIRRPATRWAPSQACRRARPRGHPAEPGRSDVHIEPLQE